MPTISETNMINTQVSAGLGCQTCGRHDSSVRLVNYSLGINFLSVSFGHEFRGRWCSLHRSGYLLLTAFLTATLGWLAFPFSLIANPIALTRLAKDKEFHKANNAKYLRSLADALQQRGDFREARKCLEASFQFVEDLWGRQELERLYSLAGVSAHPSMWGTFFSLFGLLLCAVLMGNLLGAADYFWNAFLAKSSNSVFDVLFGWVLLSALGVPFIFALREMQEWVLDRIRPIYGVLVGTLSLILGLLFIYGILQGRAIGNVLEIVWNKQSILSTQEVFKHLGTAFTRGGLLEIFRIVNNTTVNALFHGILLFLLAGYTVFTLQVRAWTIIGWQKRLKEFTPRPTVVSTLAHAVALPSVIAGLILLFSLIPQHSIFDFLEARDHFSTGLSMEYDGDLTQAISEFNLAVELDPRTAEAYEELAYCYDELDNPEKAINQAQKSIEINPKRASAHYYLGKIYYFEDNEEKAAVEFEKAVALDPALSDAYLGLAWSAYYLGNLPKAEKNFLKALELEPNLYDAYIGLGTIYEDQGETEKQVYAYEKASQSDSSSSEAYMYLGMSYYRKNDLEKAIKSLEKAVFFDSKNKLARVYLSLSYNKKGMLDRSVELGQQSLEKYPDWATAHALLAISYLELNQTEKANQEIDLALQTSERANLDEELIFRALMNARRFTEAESVIKKAMSNSQDPTHYYLHLAEIYNEEEKYSEALLACDQAEKAGDEQSDILLQRAEIYANQGLNDKSLDLLNQTIAIDPKNATAHSELSYIYYQLDNFRNALYEAQEAIRLDPYHTNAYLNLAFAQLALHKPDDAIPSAAKVAAIAPMLDMPHFVLGMSYIETGQLDLAGIELSKFLELYREGPGKQNLRDEAEKALKSLKVTL